VTSAGVRLTTSSIAAVTTRAPGTVRRAYTSAVSSANLSRWLEQQAEAQVGGHVVVQDHEPAPQLEIRAESSNASTDVSFALIILLAPAETATPHDPVRSVGASLRRAM